MKLPTDYVIPSLDELRTVVDRQFVYEVAYQETPRELEMTKEQYGAYKRLVWEDERRRNAMMMFRGMEIKISTEATTEKGDGSV